MWVEVYVTDHNNYCVYSDYHHFEENLSQEELEDKLYWDYTSFEYVIKIIDKPPCAWLEKEYKETNEKVQSLVKYREVLYDCMLDDRLARETL